MIFCVVNWIQRAWQWLGDNPNTQRSLVLVTVAIFVSALLQWSVMRETLHVTERPYLLFEGAMMMPNISPSAKPTFQAFFKNEGRTPAFVTDEETSFDTYENGLPSRPQYDKLPSQKPQNAALPPTGALVPKALWPDKLPLRKDLVNNLNNGKETLYIFGFVTYDDAFAIHHASGFCLKYVPTNDPASAKLQDCNEPNYTYYK